ncbi:hypothetical protein EYF80_053753 [Liparis tanakae]|uniref:Uncharacterized protein n=1 Tax=Liparis tanakae TaxID=230148 RepID=A0A4Z2F4C4_9TELE|nr:hypothetical protein EYF80_053753 [Liparis tanakae]
MAASCRPSSSPCPWEKKRCLRWSDHKSIQSDIWTQASAEQRASGCKDQGPGTKDQEPGTKDQGPGTRDQGPRTRDQGPGTRDQGPGSRNQGPGTRVTGTRAIVLAYLQSEPVCPPARSGGLVSISLRPPADNDSAHNGRTEPVYKVQAEPWLCREAGLPDDVC